MELSGEQNAIISAASDKDIVVNSVAGSGKTTTSLYIAKTYPEKQILLITYNKKLKLETREKIREMKLGNIEAHSYHSFCVKYYDRTCFTDQKMFNIVHKKHEPLKSYNYTTIIVDEVQDMTPLYFKLIKKILLPENQLILVGDVRQSIYEFNAADERFLSFADVLFSRELVKLSLSKSFRLSKPIAEFVNKALMGYNLMTGTNTGTIKPYYYIGSSFGDILLHLERNGFEFTTDMFVIAPSLRSEKSPARIFANKLTKRGIPIYVPVSDDEKLDTDVLAGKVVFSTIHQAKGLECDTVILYGFDNSYFKYFKKDRDPYICPNELYVACTRAKRQLVLIHGNDNNYLPFLDKNALELCCRVIDTKKIYAKKQQNTSSKITVTNLVKHIPSRLVKTLMDRLIINVIDTGSVNVSIPTKVSQGDLVESVSEITGTAIPLYYAHTSGDSILIEIYDKLKENLPDKMTPAEILRISNLWCSYKSGYKFKTVQITDFDWVSDADLHECVENLRNYIPEDSLFESKITKTICGKQIVGYTDCIVDDAVWEFKCVNKLQAEHMLQALVYKYISDSESPCYLMNIITGEVLEISCDDPEYVVAALVEHKILSFKKSTDEEFISDNI